MDDRMSRGDIGKRRGKMTPVLSKAFGAPHLLLWSKKELADALGVSRRWVTHLTGVNPELFAPRYARRGRHPRLHRVFNAYEAEMVAKLLTKVAYPGSSPVVRMVERVLEREGLRGLLGPRSLPRRLGKSGTR